MDIKSREEQGITIMEVSGRLDAATTGEFESNCAGAVENKSGCKLVIDFSGLEYISSAGLRSLLTLAKKLKGGGGDLVLCNLKGIVQEVVKLAGFDQFLPVFGNLQEAMQQK